MMAAVGETRSFSVRQSDLSSAVLTLCCSADCLFHRLRVRRRWWPSARLPIGWPCADLPGGDDRNAFRAARSGGCHVMLLCFRIVVQAGQDRRRRPGTGSALSAVCRL
jgi:hypothetical protein